jgi:two-component system sensor histidine kinase DesK
VRVVVLERALLLTDETRLLRGHGHEVVGLRGCRRCARGILPHRSGTMLALVCGVSGNAKSVWRRLTGESRASLLGAVVVAGFLLLLSLATAITTPAVSVIVNILHVALVVAVGSIFARALSQTLMEPPSAGVRIALIATAAPTLGAVWLFDWTLACVWTATAFLSFRGRRRMALFALTLANTVAALSILPGASEQNGELAVTLTLFTVFAIYIPVRLVVVSDGLLLSLEEVARLRVDEDRFRISRELHDVLGRTLVAVSLREQAALRLLELDRGDEAADQLRASHDIVADGQATLRTLTNGPTFADLPTEIASAQEICERTGITWEAHLDPAGTPRSQLLAAKIVREAITNMLKYSRPSRCWIQVRQEEELMVLVITNDGCPKDLALNSGGTGLRTLRTQCETVGGTLDARSPQPGLFRVLAHVPAALEQGS